MFTPSVAQWCNRSVSEGTSWLQTPNLLWVIKQQLWKFILNMKCLKKHNTFSCQFHKLIKCWILFMSTWTKISPLGPIIIIIIIMYIYDALINALSTHMIHINLNMILYTYVEHSPTKTVYIKYYTKTKTALRTHTHKHLAHTHTWHTHTVTVAETGYWYQLRWKYCEKKEDFQFGLKRWQGWAVSIASDSRPHWFDMFLWLKYCFK